MQYTPCPPHTPLWCKVDCTPSSEKLFKYSLTPPIQYLLPVQEDRAVHEEQDKVKLKDASAALGVGQLTLQMEEFELMHSLLR